MFQTDNYKVVRGVIKPDMAKFIYTYFKNKRAVSYYLKQHNYDERAGDLAIDWLGEFNEDSKMLGENATETFSAYADLVMETVCMDVLPVMEKHTESKLVPTYSYARIYRKGAKLIRHKDRPECEISTTLNLGGDMWPIFLEPSGELGKPGVKVELSPGDLLMYKGEKLEHWREPFDKEECCQVFLHYNDINGPHGKSRVYDRRPMMGLPNSMRYPNDE